tara:strand:+ start:1971 stop:2630 length:660 start_codon:yes stop_codon:yes gene_type:complete
MAQAKPDLTNGIWGSNGSTTDPGAAKTIIGWINENPPAEVQNWWQNRADEFITHVNQEGIAVWDAATDYPVDGLAKGSDGTVYKSLQTPNVNQDPISVPTYWELWDPSNSSLPSDNIQSDTYLTFTVSGGVPTTEESNNATVTRNGNGDYSIAYTLNMPNLKHYIIITVGSESATADRSVCIEDGTKAVSGFSFLVSGTADGAAQDPSIVDIVVMRDFS